MAPTYNPPPSWPQPPAGWTPPPGWQPDPAWGPPPPGWSLFVEQGSWVSRHRGVTIAVGVVAALVLVGGTATVVALSSDEPSVARGAGSASAGDPPSSSGEVAAEGTTVRDGDLEFVVTGLQCGLSSLPDSPLNQPPQGEFCLATVTTTNTGSTAATFSGNDQVLVGSGGSEYELDPLATISLPGDDGFFEEIDPGSSVTLRLVFDVPVGAPLACLELNDSSLDEGVRVAVSR